MSLPLSNTILLVEDDPTWQSGLRMLCEEAGYTVVLAADATAARHQSRRLQPLPILALVDLELLNSVSQQTYEGLQLLADLRDRGIYSLVVSANIPHTARSFVGQPEVYDLVDKYHLAAHNAQAEEVFLEKIRAAVAYAEAARWADGQLPEQQGRLRRLLPP